ncbi:MAG: B12-binding domain-containing radical SAM protein [Syntrophales bacterium]|jgi:radical SAM superfamily enzyme YgiQ (UPF0313 family)|nr:B12-binding domain-containing radical SAM protein [Syntrophales bacterium]MCK9527130.1 B12-binding domain-containing radical SAM protein [Syntrophales bacterium]MDX9921745.1 B12-binding domain-containing radical SAM protein [Syntrophales bacterium]
MNVLLIYPRYPTTFWSFQHALKFVAKKAAFPPLGLLTVASLLPEDWNLRLIDLNSTDLCDGDLQWADCVMISAMLVQRESADQVLSRCATLAKPVIAGGPLFTALKEEYLPRVSHLVAGEGEETIPLFVEDFKAGCARKMYQSEEFPDLTQSPIPRWDLIRVNDYASMMIQNSRGCPFNCEFCDVTTLFGHRPRLKTPVQFVAELQAIYDMGWRGGVFVVDDNFIANKKAIKEMLPSVIHWMEQRDHPFTFFTEASINIAEDDELLDMMVRAGFDSVFIGLETPNEESLRECSKTQNLGRDLVASIHKLHGRGLAVMGGYIVGFDNDDHNIFARQKRFIQETGVVTAMVGLLQALPNTRLWRRLRDENRLAAPSTGDNTDGSVNFIPAMGRQNLIRGYVTLLRAIYSPKLFHQRLFTFLENYNKPTCPMRQPGMEQVPALIKSIFYMGVLGNGISQWYFWKTLVKTLAWYRQALPEAITLMIYGHHFRKVARRLSRDALLVIEYSG